MLLVTETDAETHIASGAWGRLTLDNLLGYLARSAPERVALVDAPSRGEAASSFTFAELDRRVEILASFFTAVGLAPDTVVALQMPATSDAVVALLGALRAGLIVAPMPLAWRGADVSAALQRVGARGIITVAQVDGEPVGERARDVAAELWQIRFVFGAGGSLPDGLIDLDRVFAEADALPPTELPTRGGNPADHVATISFATTGGEAVAVPRSHNQWIATGLMAMLEAGLDHDSRLLTMLAPSGLAGLGLSLAPWLLSGGTLMLAEPTVFTALAVDIAELAPTHIVAPATLARRLAGLLDRQRSAARLVLVEHGASDHETILPQGRTVIDAMVLGEVGILIRARADAAAHAALPIGPWTTPSGLAGGPVLVEARLKALSQSAALQGRDGATTGELQLRGATVATPGWPLTPPVAFAREAARDPSDGYVGTGRRARLVATQPPAFEIGEPLGDVAIVGRHAIDLAAADRAYKTAPGVLDAAAFVLPDPLLGARIAAAVVPKPGYDVDRFTLTSYAEAARLALPLIPDVVVSLAAVPRASDGTVLRDDLANYALARR